MIQSSQSAELVNPTSLFQSCSRPSASPGRPCPRFDSPSPAFLRHWFAPKRHFFTILFCRRVSSPSSVLAALCLSPLPSGDRVSKQQVSKSPGYLLPARSDKECPAGVVVPAGFIHMAKGPAPFAASVSCASNSSRSIP